MNAVHSRLRERTVGARSDEDAAVSLKDDKYYKGLAEYGEQIGELTGSLWQEEYLKT